MLSGLGWPLLLGMAGCSLFYVLIYKGQLNTPWMHRFFTSHPILISEVAMFFVGAAALLVKLGDVMRQQYGLRRFSFEAPDQHEDTSSAAERMLRQLGDLPAGLRDSYLGARLADALTFVRRKGAVIGLEDELKYLSENDAVRQQESYSLVRIVIWATPMLGFLGTVVGITQALGDLDPQELANSIQTAMGGLLAGLYVAFDTTALALTLSILLMFVQFFIDRLETTLLAGVDEQATRAMFDRFDANGFRSDPHLIAVDRMSVAVAKTTEQLVHKQTELWRRTIDESNHQWKKMLETTGEQITSALTNSLDTSLENHATRLTHLGQEADKQLSARWEQWQTALSTNARLLHAQQEEMVRQGQVMNEVVKATGEVVKLETALNQNLHTLVGTKSFDETVMSLSAAVNLLCARLGQHGEASKRVELDKSITKGRAA